MSALTILIGVILALGGVLVALILGLIASKAARETRARRERARRAALEPRALGLVHASGKLGTAPFREAFGQNPSRIDRRVLEAVLTDHATRVEGVARERISGAFEELGFVDRYLAALGARRWWLRADAAERLGIARAKRAIDPLVARMSDSIPEVRLRAAKALGEIRGAAAVRPLIEALGQPNRWSAVRVGDVLSRMGPEASEGVREAWPTLPRPARLAALDILGRLRRLESLDFLRSVLRDGAPDERARAAHAIGMTAHPAPAPDLVRALADPDWPVRAMAAKALGRIGSPDTAAPLAAALEDKEWWVRSNAAGALKMLGPGGRKTLVEALSGKDTFARQQAVLMLQESGALAEYAGALDAADPLARKEAESMIRTLVALGRVEFIGELSREYPNPRVRSRLEELLREKTS